MSREKLIAALEAIARQAMQNKEDVQVKAAAGTLFSLIGALRFNDMEHLSAATTAYTAGALERIMAIENGR